jgi:hypothetical protein
MIAVDVQIRYPGCDLFPRGAAWSYSKHAHRKEKCVPGDQPGELVYSRLGERIPALYIGQDTEVCVGGAVGGYSAFHRSQVREQGLQALQQVFEKRPRHRRKPES